MLLTVKRSRDRSLWRKKLCCDCAMIGKMADSKKKTVFVESFRGRNRWKNKLHEWFLNTGHIVSYFAQKSCHQAEMAEICAETVVWTSRLRLHAQRCVLDILRTLVQLTAFSWRKVLRKDCGIEVGPETPRQFAHFTTAAQTVHFFLHSLIFKWTMDLNVLILEAFIEGFIFSVQINRSCRLRGNQ